MLDSQRDVSAREKLCPVLGYYVRDSWEEACDLCVAILQNEGALHRPLAYDLGIHRTVGPQQQPGNLLRLLLIQKISALRFDLLLHLLRDAYKTLISLKSGNAIVISPHPGAKKCICETVQLIQEAACKAGAPEGAGGCISLTTGPAAPPAARCRTG